MKSAAELLKAHLHYLIADFDTWNSLFAREAVIEYPYCAAAGVESLMHGIAAITQSVTGFSNHQPQQRGRYNPSAFKQPSVA
jgi:hypothetical protein